MRLAFIDIPHADGWHRTGALAAFAPLAGELARRGHEVALAAFAHADLDHGHWPQTAERLAVPIIERPAIEAAPGGLGVGRSMYDALCVAEWLSGECFDVVVAPARGGFAAYAAMAAASAPAGRHPAIALWAAATTRWKLLADRRSPRLADLVSDALERAGIQAADRVFVPEGGRAPRGKSIVPLPALPIAALPAERRAAAAATEIAFAGDFGEAAGALLFMDALERLQAQGHMAGLSVKLVGPMRASGSGLSAETLAVRAGRWGFPWEAKPEFTAAEAARFLAAPGRLAVFAGAEESYPELYMAIAAAGGKVVAPTSPFTRRNGRGRGGPRLFRREVGALVRAIEEALEAPAAEGGAAGQDEVVARWADALEGLRRPVRRAGRWPSLSVCVVHRDRPQLLERAIASIRSQEGVGEVEIVLVDDGSAGEPAQAMLSHFESTLAGKSFRLLRNSDPQFPAAARNLAAEAARGSCLIFLDDDNWLLPGGLQRLVESVASGRYDVVTSALDIEQPGAAEGTPPLRRIFLGDAGLAGLVFNGFGDASLAVTRKAFERAGGFPEEGVMAPAEDWVFLARCRKVGLRIGTLATPCFGFRRPVDLKETSWRRRYREGALARVREAYGDLAGEDLALALAYLQGLDLASRTEP
jgi:hypothetical protein